MGLAVTENRSSNRVAVKGRIKLLVVMIVCYLVSWRLFFTFDINLTVTKILKLHRFSILFFRVDSRDP